MKALRLPTRASAVTYLLRFRRPRDPSYLCVRRSAPEGWKPPPGPGVWITGRPSFRLLHVDASGISQVSRRSILCLRSAPRPRSNRRALAMAVMSVLPPLTLTTKASDNGNFEAHSRSFSTRFSYASRFVLPLTRKAGFRPAGWLAFAVRVSNPLDHYEGFQIEWSFPLPVLLTLQSFSASGIPVAHSGPQILRLL
jgi:hypothetical protein